MSCADCEAKQKISFKVDRSNLLTIHKTTSTRPPQKPATMPVHPKEEEATGNLTDQVAKESSNSNASSHSLHDADTKATSGGAATFDHHKANPGPVIADNLGEPASKEELKKRSEELNKK
ncbi:hypothetical protein WHR41_00994 [Cladosporium halotolerans]|uniref:Uncharacterized protein n=1 Tax=Cladosporium halotolerans TaxID=1052096 RepID=A0AB34L0P7_9PEZI